VPAKILFFFEIFVIFAKCFEEKRKLNLHIPTNGS
jgi:hypothetical protein